MTTSTSVVSTAAPSAIPFRIRALRALNPVVIALLRSPLHRLASRDLLVLTVTGRRTGRRYTVPVSYVQAGRTTYLCSRPGVASWWRNIGEGAEVELVLRGRRTTARAAVLASGSGEALEGLRAFTRHNPGTSELLYDVAIEKSGEPNEADLRREAPRSVVVAVNVGS